MPGPHPDVQDILPPIHDPSVHAALERLAQRYLRASGLGMQVLARLGGSAEQLLARVPAPLRAQLDEATRHGLGAALRLAGQAGLPRSGRGDGPQRVLVSAVGAVGGAAGLPGAMAELPLTITMLMRVILGIAAEHGLEPRAEETRIEALRVFADAGPLDSDDGADLGFLAARMTVTGQSLQTLIARVAPRLAAVLGQKLAAQTAPVLGALAGASINYGFARYYQEMARVHFGIIRLSSETGISRAALELALRERVEALNPKLRRAGALNPR